jgi:hypothetical protein
MDNNLSKNKSDMAIKTKGFSVNRMLIFQPSHGENKLHFDEKMMMSAQMDFYSASSVKQQSMGRHCSTWTYYSNLVTYSKKHLFEHYSGADPGFCVRWDESR